MQKAAHYEICGNVPVWRRSAGTGRRREAELDARLLLETVCHTSRNDLLVHGDREIMEEQEQQYREWIALRASRIPLQHITGVQEFMGLEFSVNENVLIPRQDTEILVEEVLRELTDGSRILDLCTGSGCILLSLLHYSNDCVGVGAIFLRRPLPSRGRMRTGWESGRISCAETYLRGLREGMILSYPIRPILRPENPGADGRGAAA